MITLSLSLCVWCMYVRACACVQRRWSFDQMLWFMPIFGTQAGTVREHYTNKKIKT